MSLKHIFYTHYSSPIGTLTLVSNGKELTHLFFDTEINLPNSAWKYSDQLPLFITTKEMLDQYFNKELKSFSNLPITTKGTPFQEKVWKTLSKINYGESISYQKLSELVSNPKATRAVANAVASNPICIVIPCHRVLGKNQTLSGFRGGLDKKEYLLNLEKINFINKGIKLVKPKINKI